MTGSSTMQVLLTGCYRTGSTYISHLLGNAPDFATEIHLTNFMRNCYGKYDPISEEEQYTSLAFDTARRVRLRSGRTVDPNAVIEDSKDGDEPVTYGGLYDAFMGRLIEEDVSGWGEKTQLVWQEIPDFLEMFDGGKAILIVRDPRSVLASFKRFTYAPEPRYLGAIFNALDAMRSGREYETRLDADKFYVTKYEDIVREPHDEVELMLEFLGLPTDHDLLSQDGWTDQEGEPWQPNSEFASGEDFDAEAAVNRWKKNLEPWEIALCERVTAAMMEAYGYELSDVSVPESEYLDIVESDAQIRSFFETWRRTGSGVQQYPRDPLEPENWTENN